MVNYSLDVVFTALGDPTRRAMVARLSQGPASIGELGRPFGITKPAVTKHVKVLERAGLLERRKVGRVHECTLNAAPLREAESWMERHRRFWEGSFDRLARALDDDLRADPDPEPDEDPDQGAST